jgi:NADP-dependent 3-hydroxy acid dehydrogenase YdfG
VTTRLTKEGARVVMVDRAADALHEQAAALASAVPVVADVSREADVESYVAQSVEEFDSVMAVNASIHLIDAAVNA